jgi:carbon-monoxide dehydrogenase small subunit
MHKKISLTVNGTKRSVEIDERESLLEVLRDKLGLTSVKQGCGVGECGACAVLIDGISIDSCIYLASWADGKEIRTVEGLTVNGELSDVQQSFVDEGAVQCGFCIPGFVISATELKESGKDYSREEIRRALSGHLCRCTGYQKIVEATEKSLKKK